jgi:hypothetical protein
MVLRTLSSGSLARSTTLWSGFTALPVVRLLGGWGGGGAIAGFARAIGGGTALGSLSAAARVEAAGFVLVLLVGALLLSAVLRLSIVLRSVAVPRSVEATPLWIAVPGGVARERFGAVFLASATMRSLMTESAGSIARSRTVGSTAGATGENRSISSLGGGESR